MRSNWSVDPAVMCGEHPGAGAVYCGMRVLCVGRHVFLSEHLCRLFSELGAECAPAVGTADAVNVAEDFEPQVVVADCELLSTTVLDGWSVAPSLCDVSVLAVSLTRRPEETVAPDLCGTAAVIYLPGLDRAQAASLLVGARRPRGVVMPAGAALPVAQPASVSR